MGSACARGGLQGMLLVTVVPGPFPWECYTRDGSTDPRQQTLVRAWSLGDERTLMSSWLGKPGQPHPLPGSVLATADPWGPFWPSRGPVRGQVVGA